MVCLRSQGHFSRKSSIISSSRLKAFNCSSREFILKFFIIKLNVQSLKFSQSITNNSKHLSPCPESYRESKGKHLTLIFFFFLFRSCFFCVFFLSGSLFFFSFWISSFFCFFWFFFFRYFFLSGRSFFFSSRSDQPFCL